MRDIRCRYLGISASGIVAGEAPGFLVTTLEQGIAHIGEDLSGRFLVGELSHQLPLERHSVVDVAEYLAHIGV